MKESRPLHLKRSAMAAVTAALMFAAAVAGPAAAYTVISESGLVGNYSLPDSAGSPGATCAYGQEVPPNWAWLKWMKVRAPQAFAADRNSGARDQRRVSWQFKIQRAPYDMSEPWQTVATSVVQRRTAYEDQAAAFTPIQVNYNATTSQPGSENDLLRALVILKWYRPNGSVEGTVKLAPTNYRNKSPFGVNTTGNSWCQARVTSG